jgi:hypothetical protein
VAIEAMDVECFQFHVFFITFVTCRAFFISIFLMFVKFFSANAGYIDILTPFCFSQFSCSL